MRVIRFPLLLLATGLLWLGLALGFPQSGQTKVWYLEGREYLSDYFMTRNTAAHANPSRDSAHTRSFSFLRGGHIVEREGWDLEERDRAYPAGALLILLPFEESLKGAHVYNAVMIGAFLLVLTFCLRFLVSSPGARFGILFALLLSGPMLFAYERGNSIWLAAAGSMGFLLFWDHPRRSVRWLAAAGLAVAASIKVMPAVFGLLYLSRFVRPQRREGAAGPGVALVDPIVCALFGLVAFLVPWFFVAGFDSFSDWWRTGHANVEFYSPRTVFGFVDVYRTVMIGLHRGWEATVGFRIARGVSVVCGACLLGLAVWKVSRSRYAGVLLVTAGLLFLGANMRQYTVLYLLPAFLLWLEERTAGSRRRLFESVAWFFILTPLQIPFGTLRHDLLVNLAMMYLTASVLFQSQDQKFGDRIKSDH